MTSLHSRAASGAGTAMRDLKWSPAEKAIARKAFDRALGRELEAVILETKNKAAKNQKPSRPLGLERYLPQLPSPSFCFQDDRLPLPPQRPDPKSTPLN